MDRTSSTFDHPNLAVERAQSTFNEADMTDFLNGSHAETVVQKAIMLELEELKAKEASGAPIDLDGGAASLDSAGIMPNQDHTLEEARLQTMKMLRFQYDRLFNAEDSSARMRRARMELMSLFDPAWFTRNGVHFGLWGGAIMGQGDEEQVGEWYPKTVSMEIFGCFGMTEIGHGSFVRGLETTATYDPATRTFDIHTPRLEATKWWIGGAAKTATHCAVFAQLVMPDGSRPGVHTFVVQLRSLDDHSVLPGIRVGDCGAKFGRNGLDNGFLQFNHVRVPREAMLCKYASVSEDGTRYEQRGRKQLQYGALIGGRAIMVTDSAIWLKAAVTIAVRYLTLRRQGDPLEPSGREPQLLDFRTVQTRVCPLVATAYALNFTSQYMQRVAPMQGLADEDEEPLSEEEKAAVLPDLHATCAGLKAFSTWSCYHGIDTLRQCLGGHGYSGYTALGRMFTDFAVQCTWEGDNTVMALQTARYLVASYERLDRGEELTGSVSYLTSLPRINRIKRQWSIKTEADLRVGSLRAFLDAFRFLLAKKVERVSLKLRDEKRRAARTIEKQKAKARQRRGKAKAATAAVAAAAAAAAAANSAAADPELADRCSWNDNTPELLDCSRGHCYFVMAENFVNAVERAALSADVGERRLVSTLDKLCRLFMCHSLSNWVDWFLAMGYFDKRQMFLLKEGTVSLCQEVRDFALPAVDAFGLSDTLLRSPLGRRDGDVYEHYFGRVLQKPGAEEQAAYYDSQIRPLLQSNL